MLAAQRHRAACFGTIRISPQSRPAGHVATASLLKLVTTLAGDRIHKLFLPIAL
jgi:hypothetical protein